MRAVTALLRATGVLALFLCVYIQYRILVHLHIRGLCCLSFISSPCKNLMKRRQLPQGCVRGGCQTLHLTFTLWCWSKKSSASFGVNLCPVILVLMESPTLLREDWEISSPPCCRTLPKFDWSAQTRAGRWYFMQADQWLSRPTSELPFYCYRSKAESPLLMAHWLMHRLRLTSLFSLPSSPPTI